MAKKKSRPAKKAISEPAEIAHTLQSIEHQLVEQLQRYGDQVGRLERVKPREADKVLNRLASVKQASKLVRANTGPLDKLAIQRILRELASGIRSAERPPRVAFLGPLHSYSHLATLRQFGSSAELIPVRTISAVFDEVASGHVGAGVVPIENSTDGRIVDTLEMLTRSPVKICGEIPLRIHHNLLGTGRREQIKEVCSKPQALSQCREWLAHHLPHAKITTTSSTTAAAERAQADAHVAAVASRQAGVEYGLRTLAENIEDNPDNVTRFAVISLEVAKKTKADKTSLMFELHHQPGALADAMVIFKRNRLNLTWIESFPKPGSPNEYLFFVELLGYQSDLRVRRALSALEKKTVRLEILGSYAQAAAE